MWKGYESHPHAVPLEKEAWGCRNEEPYILERLRREVNPHPSPTKCLIPTPHLPLLIARSPRIRFPNPVLSQCELKKSRLIEVEGLGGLMGGAACGIAWGRGRLLPERGGHRGRLDVNHPGVHDLTLDLHHLLIVPWGPPARHRLCEKGRQTVVGGAR